MKKELEEECAKHLDEWQVKGKNRRTRYDSNASGAVIGEENARSSKAKSNSESSNTSGKEGDEGSSGGRPSDNQKNQGFGSNFAEQISSIMSRFTLESGTAGSDPTAARDDSTAEVTSPSSKANDAPKNESSSQAPELDNLPKEDQQPLTL